MPRIEDVTVPGTLSCPRTCCRSSGMPYRAARYRTRRADARYIASVYQESGAVRKPSCSRPTDLAFTNQLPACQPTSFSARCCATCPSEERSEYCHDTYSGSCTRPRVTSQVASVSWTTM